MDKIDAAGSAVRAATTDNNVKALIGVRLRVMVDKMAAGAMAVSLEDEIDWLLRIGDLIGD